MWIQLLTGILLIAAFFLLVIIIDGNRFVIKEYQLSDTKLKKEVTYVLLADLHDKDYGSGNRKLRRAIKKINPDGILVAGDMVSANKGEDYSTALSLLLELSKAYPIYYGNGNHESKIERYPGIYGNAGCSYQTYKNSLIKAGVHFLLNDHIYLPAANIDIYGLETKGEYYQRFFTYPMKENFLKQNLGTPNHNHTNILIAHNPEYFKDYGRWGADLVVSGHIHGGMMRLPLLGGVISPKVRLFPKYDGGIFKEKGTTMIISRGIGDHWPNIRIFNPAELVVIRLSPGNQ